MPLHYLRILWARKWLFLTLFVPIFGIGAGYAATRPQQFAAQTSLIIEMRSDPALGALTPALAAPGYMATQLEVIRSERVASRVYGLLDLEHSTSAIALWQDSTNGKTPMARFYVAALQRGLTVEPSPGSNVLNLTFTSSDPLFSQSAANAFAQAYMDTSVELRVAPARQSAAFLDDQSKTLRATLESAQRQLSKYQQSKGIVATDERLDQENARYNALLAQLALAQAENVDSSARQRNSGTETSPDVLSSAAVGSLKAQLAAAETKLIEISAVVGKNHPTRVQLEAQIGELKQQLAAEVRRVTSSASVSDRGSAQKVAALQAMSDQQKKQLLSLRADRDQISVYVRDVETAQRSYDAVTQRLGQLTLEGQNSQANTRLLSAALEPLEPSRSKKMQDILGSLVAGLVVASLAALLLEMMDRRIHGIEDLTAIPGVPVIGILRPAGSRRPVFRRLALGNPDPPPRATFRDLRLRP